MPRGKAANIGDVRVSQNGYHYTRTEQGWRLTHHIAAEKYLGRSLHRDERVEFTGKDKTDFSESNIRVVRQGRGSLRRRKAQLQERIRELQAELAEIERDLLR